MKITRPDDKDAFYMGSMTYLHQIPPQHKEGSTGEITKRITELKDASTRLGRLIKAEEGFLEDQAWLGSDSRDSKADSGPQMGRGGQQCLQINCAQN
jgi:hypothetical protein